MRLLPTAPSSFCAAAVAAVTWIQIPRVEATESRQLRAQILTYEFEIERHSEARDRACRFQAVSKVIDWAEAEFRAMEPRIQEGTTEFLERAQEELTPQELDHWESVRLESDAIRRRAYETLLVISLVGRRAELRIRAIAGTENGRTRKLCELYWLDAVRYQGLRAWARLALNDLEWVEKSDSVLFVRDAAREAPL